MFATRAPPSGGAEGRGGLHEVYTFEHAATALGFKEKREEKQKIADF
jgi:hypothetical protein